MPRNISYAENALRLRQAILDGLQQVNTIKELSKLMFAENPLMKASINNVNYHIQYLIDEGYVKQTGQITINSSRAFTYKAIITQYKLPVTFCKNRDYVEKPAPQVTIKGARLIRLTDVHHHAKIPPKQRSAWIGSTMGTMSF